MESQKEYVSVEYPLKHGQICIKWVTLVPEITNILNEKDDYSTKARKKILILILSDEFCEEQEFRYLLLYVNLPMSLFKKFQ